MYHLKFGDLLLQHHGCQSAQSMGQAHSHQIKSLKAEEKKQIVQI